MEEGEELRVMGYELRVTALINSQKSMEIVITCQMNIDIERKLIEKFVIRDKKKRYLSFIEKEKTRKKFLNELYHFRDFNWKLFEKIPGNKNEVEMILEKLNDKKNITSCYVISVDKNFDGKIFSTKDAIEKIVWIEGTIKVFGEADVVYYEGEAPDRRFISK